MSAPTVATIKRLYAVSGNQCAFPRCRNPLVDAGGKVTGRICHIRGDKPSAARHDSAQSDAERQKFDNLVLMCPIHHDVIDSDPESYTVSRLIEIKGAHERAHARESEPSEGLANALLQNIGDSATIHGSVIYTNQQMGGQVAHSITNLGPRPRQLSDSASNALTTTLMQLPPIEVELLVQVGDAEGFEFATQLKGILDASGWTVDGVTHAITTPAPRGLVISTPALSPALQALGDFLLHARIQTRGELAADRTKPRILVGSSA